MRTIDEKIKFLESTIENNKRELEALKNEKLGIIPLINCSTQEERDFADDLHKLTCHDNHIDMCGYYYETWEKTLSNSFEYRGSKNGCLKMARKLMKLNIPKEKIIQVIKIAKWKDDEKA